MVRVKICGITNWADAEAALGAGAHALGFNFYPPSSRYIPPSHARTICTRMPSGVDAVGVFVNASYEETDEIALSTDLDVVQLHGEEPLGTVEQISNVWPLIKVFRVNEDFDVAALAAYKKLTDFFLLDGFSEALRG